MKRPPRWFTLLSTMCCLSNAVMAGFDRQPGEAVAWSVAFAAFAAHYLADVMQGWSGAASPEGKP